MTTLASFLLAIAILVFVHEMGHYLAARQCGIQVLRFSIGFGQPLLKWTAKKSGTEWVVALIPLGGYVRMNDTSFDQKSLLARSWVVFAGPLANLIFASVAYAFLFSMGRDEPQPVIAAPAAQSPAAIAGLGQGDRVLEVNGQSIRSFTDLRWRMAQALVGDGASSISLKVAQPSGAVADISIQTQVSESAQTSHPGQPSQASQAGQARQKQQGDPARQIQALGLAPLSTGVKIARVLPGSAAEQAGLRPGDQILWVGQVEITQPEQVIAQIGASGGQPLVLVVSDGGPPERVTLTPQPGPEGSFRMGAVVAAEVATTRVADSPLQAAWRGTVRTWEMSILTFQALGRMIMGEISWRQISGPVAIADAAGQSAVSGFQAFLGFLAIISISIAVLNLLPIPMLDGGHLLYYLWELVRGSPLPAEVQDAGRRIGLALIVLLTVVALYNDFARIVGW